jgi:molybdopterin-guanine dinucleotide biosynthesis protein A
VKKFEIHLVIFAGGKSFRMGRDKSLLPFGNFPTLLEYQFNRLSKLFSEVYISWKSEKVDGFENISILDLETYSHISAPTVGLFSSMKKLDSDYVAICSVDTPFFDDFGKLIAELEKSPEIVSPQIGDRGEPLLSVYKTSLFPKVEEMLKIEEHRLQVLLKNSDTIFVPFEKSDKFANMNYPKEYEKYKRVF